MADPDEMAAFHSMVAPYDRSDPAAHAFWTGPRVNGYGMVGHEWAHRIAYRLHRGEIAPGLVIRHLCNTRSCVRIEHLKPGTQTENMADMVEAGRTSVLGPLSDEDVVGLNIPTGIPLRYDLDGDLKPTVPGGTYLDPEAAAAGAAAVAAQGAK